MERGRERLVESLDECLGSEVTYGLKANPASGQGQNGEDSPASLWDSSCRLWRSVL